MGHSTYNCNASIPSLPINYTKLFDFESGSTKVQQVSSIYSYSSFSKAACKEKAKEEDLVRINEGIVGV